jgi:predicted MPP superfamily phosphohydrolase
MKNKALSTICFLSLTAALTSCGSSYTYKDVNPYKLEMAYKNGFRIMQWTDVHLGIQSDLENVKGILKKDVETAKPDLIVLTGDTFMDATKSLVINTLDFIDSLNVPFAFTFGNHDLQGDYDCFYVQEQVKLRKNAKFVDYENDQIYGQMNYFIDLKDGSTTKYRLYIIDSNSYHRVGMLYPYDIIHEEQIQHIEQIVDTDGAAPGLAFYHIPLYEWKDAYNAIYVDTTSAFYHQAAYGYDASLDQHENVSCPYKRTDAFARFKAAGIKAMFVGHDHINNTTMLWNDVVLSYGMKSSYEIYNEKIGYTLITLDDSGTCGLSNVKKVVVG